MIKRSIANRFLDYLDSFPVVGLIGPRQVGKTTLVKMSSNAFKKESIYLDLESPADLNKLQDPELFLLDHQDKTVIIDEIQLMPSLFPVLRSIVDRNRQPGRFVLLGSASPEIIRESSESLAGRIAYLELNPFDIVELQGKKTSDLLWLKGGFPEAVLQERDDMSIVWMQNFIRTYIERDLPQMGLGAPLKTIERLWSMLAHINGKILNYSNLANSLGISVNSVKSYINFFEKAFLIRILQPFHMNTKKRLVKSPKIYFKDTGLLHYQMRIFDKEDIYGHPDKGSSWECFVIQQISNNLPAAHDTWFYRTQDGSELDLVITKGNNIVAGIEIKLSNAPKLSRGNTLAIETINCNNNFIITPSSEDYQIRENVRICGLETFVSYYLFKMN